MQGADTDTEVYDPFHSIHIDVPEHKDLTAAFVSRIAKPLWCDIGWIPLLKSRRHWPPYAQAVGVLERHRVLLHLLFRSGNLSVPDHPGNPDPEKIDLDALLRIEESKNYRSLFALKNLKIFWDSSGKPISAEFDFFAKTGFTPIRVPGVDKPLFFVEGIEDELNIDPSLEADGRLRLHFTFPFQLSRKMNRLTRIVGGRWAPWAWMGMSMVIARQTIQFHFIGSAIPNQSRYSNTHQRYPYTGKRGTYNLLTADHDVIRQFFDADQDEMGPASSEALDEIEYKTLPAVPVQI